jgi:hypothetical protein
MNNTILLTTRERMELHRLLAFRTHWAAQGRALLSSFGIQLLIAAALIGGHQEERTSKPPPTTEKRDSTEAGTGVVKESVEQGKKS